MKYPLFTHPKPRFEIGIGYTHTVRPVNYLVEVLKNNEFSMTLQKICTCASMVRLDYLVIWISLYRINKLK